jgi:hypothetical protein
MKIDIKFRVVGPQAATRKFAKFLKRAEFVVLESVSLPDYIATPLMPPKVEGGDTLIY